MQNYPRDIIGAFAYFSQQVSQLHGGGQLEDCKYQKHCILVVNTVEVEAMGMDMAMDVDKGAAEDKGVKVVITKRLGGKTVINGIDVSDPTHSFTAQEWEALQHMNNHGGRGHGTRGHNWHDDSAANTE